MKIEIVFAVLIAVSSHVGGMRSKGDDSDKCAGRPFTGSLKDVGRACESPGGDGICSLKCGTGTFDGGPNYYCLSKELKCCVIDYRPGPGMRCGSKSSSKVCAAKVYCKDNRKTVLPLCAAGSHCCDKLPGRGETCDRGKGDIGICTSYRSKCRGRTTKTCSRGYKCCKGKGGRVEWDYQGAFGMDNWEKNFPDCGKKRQSPVDIRSKKVKLSSSDVSFTNYDVVPDADYVIENNGHTAEMAPTASTPEVGITLANGIFYTFLQLHFHWGSNDYLGSEHTIDGESFPLELHFVNANLKSPDPSADGDGLAVLGVFFEIGGYNEDLEPIIESLKNIRWEDTMTPVQPFALDSLLPKSKALYRYEGSLTTPPCSEAVIWSVFQEPLSISKKQLAEFRKLIDNFGEKMVNNFRSTQHLFGRRVMFQKKSIRPSRGR